LTSPTLGIGVIGAGNISTTYMRNAALFRGLRLVACADLSAEAAARRAAEHGLRPLTVDGLLADPEVALVLNLTVPAAHLAVTEAALSAGKHVFTEKPLATSAADGRRLVAAAKARGLLLGSAPDTFLGAAGRRARRLLDAGAIGRPVAGTAFMFGHGMEHWHPNPQFYYQPGGGPLFDMGPYYLTMLVNLLGPVAQVQAVATRGQDERLVTAPGPFEGTRFPVGTPTTILALLEFAAGAMVSFGTSWDVFRHTPPPIELHGTEGSLRLPDPDTFGGTVSLSARGADWRDHASDGEPCGAPNWPYDAPDRANYRMLGVADLVRALQEGRAPRASGDLALHVLEVMEAITTAAQSRSAVPVPAAAVRPPLLAEDETRALLA
jgi:predicted dehydrogenase